MLYKQLLLLHKHELQQGKRALFQAHRCVGFPLKPSLGGGMGGEPARFPAPEVAPVIGAPPWATAARIDPMQRDLNEADRYARREYGGPDAAWLRSAGQPARVRKSPAEVPDGEHLIHWITRVVAAFF